MIDLKQQEYDNAVVEMTQWEQVATQAFNTVATMVQGVTQEEVDRIKRFTWKFENNEIIIIDKQWEKPNPPIPAVKNQAGETWSYYPYDFAGVLNIRDIPKAREYRVSMAQDFDYEMLVIAKALNPMNPELLSQQTQYMTVKKMSQDHLLKFLKR